MNSIGKANNYDEIVTNIRIIGCALSIGTSVIVQFLYWFFKDNHNFTMSKIATLSLANAMFSLSLILPYNNQIDLICQIQSFLINTFQLTQYFASCVLCYCTFISIIKKNHLEKHKTFYRIFFFLIEMGLPISLSSIVLYTKSYGDSGGYCWLDVNSNLKRIFIQKLSLNIFACLWFLLLLNIFFIVKIHVIIKKNKNTNKELYNHLLIYPIIMVVTASPGTVYRVNGLVNKQQFNEYWKIAMVFCESFCGVIVNVVFVASPWVRQTIINACYNFRYQRGGIKEDGNYIDTNYDSVDTNLFNSEEEEEEGEEEEQIENNN